MGGARSYFQEDQRGAGLWTTTSSMHCFPRWGWIQAEFRRRGRLRAASSSVLLRAREWLSWLRVLTVPNLKFLLGELQPEFLFGGHFQLLEEAAVVAGPALDVE